MLIIEIIIWGLLSASLLCWAVIVLRLLQITRDDKNNPFERDD